MNKKTFAIKATLFLFSFLLVFCPAVLAQPANDNCSGAQSLGTLPQPGNCGAGLQNGATANASGTTVNATPENPYVTLAGCGMASPANSVWYSFVAPTNGFGVNIAITGSTFNNPNIALWQGNNCNSLTGVGCIVGAGPNATLNIPAGIVPGNTYYIQVTTNSLADQGTFNLAVNAFQDCSDCLKSSTLTVTPLPVNGTYQPGQAVTFCFHINQYTQVNQNWLHGVQLLFGNGWDLSTLTTNPPSSIGNCNPSTWQYYPGGIIDNSGQPWPAGFYFDGNCALGPGSNDGNPGNNYGDTDNGASGAVITPAANEWNFCWTINVLSGCNPGMALNVTVNTSGDGESGSWTNGGCASDPPTTFNALIACCPPTATSTSVTCNGGNNGTATVTPVGSNPPYSYSWSNGQTTSTATGLSAGTYTATVIDGDLCAASATVTVTQPTALTTTVSSTPASCGSSNGTATVSAGGGTPGYTYLWSNSQTTATATGLAGGNCTVTVTDANGCIAVNTVSVTSNSGGTASIQSSTNVTCNGANNGSATATMTGGTPNYTYLWNNGQTSSTATGLSNGTYTVTVTDANGCTGTTTVTITQPTALSASVTTTNSTCTASNGTASVSSSGGTGAYTYLWTPSGQTTSTATGLSSGTYSATVTDANGCTFSLSATVNSTGGGTASIQSSSNVSCNGGNNGSATATMTGGTPNYTYLWSNGQTTSTASGLIAGGYTVTVTDANGCSSVTTATISQPTALASTQSQVDLLCNGAGNGSATINVSNGTPGYSYSWTNGQTTSSSTGMAAGNYSVTVTDANGCTLVSSFVITEPAAISATSSSASEICNQANGNATISPSGGTGAYTYSWNPSSQTTSSATGLTSGNYSVLITDANGCTFSSVVNVGATGGPTANAGSPVSFCFGNSTTLSASGGGNYSWVPAAGLNSTTISNPVANPNATTTYTVIVTDVNGCSSADSVMVTVNQLPVPNAGPDISVCAGISATINASGGGNYSWTPSAGLSNSTISNPVANPAATTTYTLIVTDANGCMNADSVIVNISALPVVAFSAPNECFNTATQFTDQSAGATTWSWNFGEPSSGPNNVSSMQNPSHTYGNDGSFVVTLVVTNAAGCTDSLSKTVFVNPLPFAMFLHTSVCVGNPVFFTDASTVSSGSITGWSWNFADPASGSNNISTIQNPSHTYTTSGTFNVILTATTDSGCQSTTVLGVTVSPKPVAAFTFQNICENSPAQFTDGSSGATQWSWIFGDGNTSTQQSPSHTYAGYGTYVVALIVSSATSCSDTVSDTISVYPVPVADFTTDSVCLGNANSFFETSFIPQGTISSLSWNFGDGNTSSSQNPTHIYSSSGTYTTTLTVTSNNGCSIAVSHVAVVYAQPTAQFSSSPSSVLEIGETMAFTDLSFSNIAQWFWDFGDSITSTDQNPTHMYNDTGTYVVTLIVVSQYGCVDAVEQIVRMYDFAFYVPNAFTPNGDGHNDFFGGVGVGIVKYQLLIFDRWGNMIFISENYNERWNGTVRGTGEEVVQEDVYVWKIEVESIFKKTHNYMGSVTVVK